MTLLTKPTPQGIRDNLKERLEAECIYTYIGNVLVAANPFTWLQIYSSEDAKRYMRQSRLDVPPHVFAVAEAAFRAMTEEEDSQCVIISGESGAGKTEASKHIQGYFALCSQGNSAEVERVKKVFLESNPLLEAFGNAKTLRNNNSSLHKRDGAQFTSERFNLMNKNSFKKHRVHLGQHLATHPFRKRKYLKMKWKH